MDRILKSNRLAHPELTEVTINDQAIEAFIDSLDTNNLKDSELEIFKKPWGLSEFFKLSLVFNSINFCYWAEKGKPKWNVTVDDQTLDGSAALAGLLEDLAENDNLSDWPLLADLDWEEFKGWLAGNDVEIPLLKERHQNLTLLATQIQNRYRGDSDLIFENSDNCAERMLKLLIQIPGFDDQSAFSGQKIYFYKRAQLQVKMFSDYLLSQTGRPLKNLNALTAFSDYKVPQILRHLDILHYSPALTKTIDNYQQVPKDSKAENEIRIATIIAVDQIATKTQKRNREITAAQVDSLLWQRAAANQDPMAPYHRTYTTAY